MSMGYQSQSPPGALGKGLPSTTAPITIEGSMEGSAMVPVSTWGTRERSAKYHSPHHSRAAWKGTSLHRLGSL